MRSPADELDALRAQNLDRRLRSVASYEGPLIRLADGRELTQFAANDYLGMASSEELKEALAEGAREYGAGAGASRLITGSHVAHDELEQLLAEWKGAERALSFSTGYAAAVGTLTALLGKSDFIILDKLCHASLIDGARLSGATIRVFPHNDLGKLERRLDWARSKAGPNSDSRILIVTESVFSMEGDTADLRAIAELKSRFGALLLVDEAHAVGVIGREGCGLAEEAGVGGDVDFQMGTLSKAIGVAGGYLAASAEWIDLLINCARSFIYSTAPPPAIASAAAESIRLIRGELGEQRRIKLWQNIRALDEALKRTQASESAIIPYIIGESQAALDLSRALEKRGLLVPAIRFPTVPRDTARLRISLSALHTIEQINGLAEALTDH